MLDKNERLMLAKVMVAHGLVHGYMLIIPLIIPIWMEQLAITEATIGIVVTAGYSVFGISNLPAGYLVDKIGSYRIMQICLGGSALALLFGSLVQGITSLTIVLVLLGLFSGLYHPAGLTLISKKISQRGKALGLHGVGGNLGIALLPLLGGILLLFIGWKTLFIIYALPAAFLALTLNWGIPAKIETDESLAEETAEVNYKGLVNNTFLFILLIYLCGGLYYRGSLTFLPKFLETISLPDITILGESLPPQRYLYSGLLIFGLMGQIASGIISDHYPQEKILLIVYSSTAILLVGISVIGGPVQIGLLMLFGFLLFAIQPLQNNLVAKHTVSKRRGLSYGLTFLSSFGFGALGATLSGFVIQNYSYSIFFISLAGFALLGGLVTFRLDKIIKQQSN